MNIKKFYNFKEASIYAKNISIEFSISTSLCKENEEWIVKYNLPEKNYSKNITKKNIKNSQLTKNTNNKENIELYDKINDKDLVDILNSDAKIDESKKKITRDIVRFRNNHNKNHIYYKTFSDNDLIKIYFENKKISIRERGIIKDVVIGRNPKSFNMHEEYYNKFSDDELADLLLSQDEKIYSRDKAIIERLINERIRKAKFEKNNIKRKIYYSKLESYYDKMSDTSLKNILKKNNSINYKVKEIINNILLTRKKDSQQINKYRKEKNNHLEKMKIHYESLDCDKLREVYNNDKEIDAYEKTLIRSIIRKKKGIQS